MSRLSKRETSVGGIEKIKKSWGRTPLLASASAHLFTSLKQCWILTLGIFLRYSLQSATITSVPLKLPASFYRWSTTSFTSSSISTTARFRLMHILIPSHKGHNSAAMLAVNPITLAYPHTQSPWEFLMIPPPQLARPRSPKEDSSEFNLNQLSPKGVPPDLNGS